MANNELPAIMALSKLASRDRDQVKGHLGVSVKVALDCDHCSHSETLNCEDEYRIGEALEYGSMGALVIELADDRGWRVMSWDKGDEYSDPPQNRLLCPHCAREVREGLGQLAGIILNPDS